MLINRVGGGGTNTKDATATESDLLEGVTAYVNGEKITGTIIGKDAASYTPGTTDQTIAAKQYLKGIQTIKGDANLVSENIKGGVSIFGVEGNSNVVDTSTGTAVADDMLNGKIAFVDGAKVTGTIVSKEAATITPGTTDQTIAAKQYLSGAQTIKGDANLISANIKSGVSIFGVAGNTNVVDTSGGDATAAQILSGKKAYVDGKLVTGTIASKAAATITPGTTNQTIAASQYLSGVQTIKGDANLVSANIKSGISIFGVSGNSNVVDTSAGTATAAQILSGKIAYVDGKKITGTIASQGAQTITPGTANKTIASGKYLSGTQTIKGDANLVAGNIKKGTSIFGVTGTYDPMSSVSGYKSSNTAPKQGAASISLPSPAKLIAILPVTHSSTSSYQSYSQGVFLIFPAANKYIKFWGRYGSDIPYTSEILDLSVAGHIIGGIPFGGGSFSNVGTLRNMNSASDSTMALTCSDDLMSFTYHRGNAGGSVDTPILFIY